MDTKLTIKLNDDVISSAKRYAQHRKTSIYNDLATQTILSCHQNLYSFTWSSSTGQPLLCLLILQGINRVP